MLRILLWTLMVAVVRSQEYRLLFSHVIYRHGDRSPSRTFPNDKYQASAWPMGWSQLTPQGIRRMYDLGTYLRRRYSNFLSSDFNRDEIYVRSTSKDRALESAQSTLAGLYAGPPQSDCNAVRPGGAEWKPIAIHSVSTLNDYLLLTDADDICPSYQDAYREQTDHVIEEINKKHAALFDFLKNKTGLEKVDFSKVGMIGGALSREKEQGWELVEWADQVWNQTSGETVYDILSQLKEQRRIFEYNSLEKIKFMSGFLTGDIVNRMKMRSAGKLKSPSKMMMYSSHEGTVMGLLFAFNIYNDQLVPYSGCLIVELHESTINKNQYFVTIHYRNDTDKDPYAVLPPECQSAAVSGIYCPLEVFEKSVQRIILYPESNLEKECRIDKCSHVKVSASSRTNFAPEAGMTVILVLGYVFGNMLSSRRQIFCWLYAVV